MDVCYKKFITQTLYPTFQSFKKLLNTFENIAGKGDLAGNKAFFSDSHNVFYSVNLFPIKHWFLKCLQYKSFENSTVGKGEIARNEQFLLFQQCFLPV